MNHSNRAAEEKQLSDDISARWLLGILIGVTVLLLVALIAGVAALLSLKRTVPATQLVYSIQNSDSPAELVTSEQMVMPLTRRVRELFGVEVEVNAMDDNQVEIILPTRDPMQIAIAKDLLVSTGKLQFLPIANSTRHASVLELVQQTTHSPTSQRDVHDSNGDRLARWVTVGVDANLGSAEQIAPLKTVLTSPVVRNSETGEVITLPEELLGNDSPTKVARWLQEQHIASVDVLAVLNKTQSLDGQDIAYAASTFDENGRPTVSIQFTEAGSQRMFTMCNDNAPLGNVFTQLGIILDDRLLTAPNLMEPIRQEARITGNFTQEEVDLIVQLLKAGQLPAKLNPTPVVESQTTMSYSLLHSFMQ
jgi:SecD/SecF fusion protein